MTDDLRELQIQQLTLMQGTERLISTCSKTRIRDYPDPKTIAHGARLREISGELSRVPTRRSLVSGGEI